MHHSNFRSQIKEYSLNRDLSRCNYILKIVDRNHGGALTDRVGAEPGDQIRSRSIGVLR